MFFLLAKERQLREINKVEPRDPRTARCALVRPCKNTVAPTRTERCVHPWSTLQPLPPVSFSIISLETGDSPKLESMTSKFPV